MCNAMPAFIAKKMALKSFCIITELYTCSLKFVNTLICLEGIEREKRERKKKEREKEGY